MDISGNNIDKWFFDYLEGNLSNSQVKKLNEFLAEHPWHAEEFEAWKQTYQTPASPKQEFENKAALYKGSGISEYLKYAAVAIVLFGMGSLTTYLYMSSFQSGENLSSLTTEVSKSNSNNPINTTETNLEQQNTDAVQNNFTSSESIDEKSEYDSELHGNSVSNESSAPTNQSFSSSNVRENNRIRSNDYSVTANEEVEKAESASSFENLDQKSLTAEENSNDESTLPYPIDENEKREKIALLKDLNNPENQSGLNISLTQHIDKIKDNDFTPNYIENPLFSLSDIELEFAKSGLKKTYRLKKMTKMVVRMLDDPIALTNLRDPNLVIPGYNPIRFNGAFAGSMYSGRWETVHRYQWHNSENASHRTISSYDSYVKALKGGIGVVASFSDFNQGMYRDFDLSLVYSPKFRISKNASFEPAVKFNMGMVQLNQSRFNGKPVEWSRGDVMQTFSNPDVVPGSQLIYKDIGVGSLLNTKWFYAGFSVDNVFRHMKNVFNTDEFGFSYRAPTAISAVIGTDYQSFNNPNLVVSPHVTYQKIGDREEIWMGTHFRWNWMILGASLSSNIDYKAMVGFQKNAFRLTYSYDQTYSWMANTSLPSHELNLKLLINNKNYRIPNKRY